MINKPGLYYGEWLMRWRWSLLILIAIIFFTAVSGLRLLSFNADYKVFFEKDDPQLLALEEMDNVYSKDEGIVFILAPIKGDIFNHATLNSIEQLTEMAWQLPFAIRVESLSNYQHTYANQDDLFVNDLFNDALKLNDQELAKIKHIALNEPQLINRMVNTKGDVTAINVTTILPGLNPMTETPEVIAVARKIITQLKSKNPEINIYLTGVLALNNAFNEVGELDMTTVTPLSFIAIFLGVLVFFRRLTATFTTFVVVIGSILSAVGLAGWLGIVLTNASVSAPLMILTLAVANSIHILVT